MDKLKFVSKWMRRILGYQATIGYQKMVIFSLKVQNQILKRDIKRFENDDLNYWEHHIDFGGTNDGRKRKSDGR